MPESLQVSGSSSSISPLSSQNLVHDHGFSSLAGRHAAHWQSVAPHDSALECTEVPDFDRNGLPFSSYAAVLSGGARIGQDIDLPDETYDQFAFRITARSRSAASRCTLTARLRAPDGTPLSEHRAEFTVGSEWQRLRTEFAAPDRVGGAGMALEIGHAEAEGELLVTDVRLVSLAARNADFRVRFDTRGDINLPSTRLRALMLEDHLNLLGMQTLLNGGSQYDLLVCQKVKPWLKFASARLRGRKVLYDLDDNHLILAGLEGRNTAAFSRVVDGVTAGGTYLQERLSRPDRPAFLLENPVDILDRSVFHTNETWRNRLVWFGMPENGWMVDELCLPQPVTRITRGGDLAFDVKTIDRELTTFDLALMPVTLNDRTRAKNANRLIKCTGLGLPFLASDTPEHRRAVERLGLPERFLIREGESWPDRIAEIAADYAACKVAMAAARETVFAAYGIEAIAAGWIAYCARLLAAGPRGIPLPHRGQRRTPASHV